MLKGPVRSSDCMAGHVTALWTCSTVSLLLFMECSMVCLARRQRRNNINHWVRLITRYANAQSSLERATGFEPVPEAWKALMLPLTPSPHRRLRFRNGGEVGNRTHIGSRSNRFTGGGRTILLIPLHWSDHRESNPNTYLGKVEGFRYIMVAMVPPHPLRNAPPVPDRLSTRIRGLWSHDHQGALDCRSSAGEVLRFSLCRRNEH